MASRRQVFFRERRLSQLKGYENNPVVQKYIKNETFLVVKKKSKVVQDPDKDKGAGIQSLDDQAGGGVTDNQDDLTKGKDQKG